MRKEAANRGGLLTRMIRLVVMAVLGRVHDDRRPAMGLVPIRMHDIRLRVVIRSASRIGARGNRETSGGTEQRQFAHGDHS